MATQQDNWDNSLKYLRIGLYNFYQQIALGDPPLVKVARDHNAIITQQEEDLSMAYRKSKFPIANFFHTTKKHLKETGFTINYTYIFSAKTGEKIVEHIDKLIKSKTK